jgi:hypothetical protein
MKVYGGRYLLSAELASLGLRTVGADVQIHSTCIMVGLENISIGDHVRIDAFSSLIAGSGHIAIGSHVHIAGDVFMSGAEGIELSEFCRDQPRRRNIHQQRRLHRCGIDGTDHTGRVSQVRRRPGPPGPSCGDRFGLDHFARSHDRRGQHGRRAVSGEDGP